MTAHRAPGLLQLAGGHHGPELFTTQVSTEGGLRDVADDDRTPKGRLPLRASALPG